MIVLWFVLGWVAGESVLERLNLHPEHVPLVVNRGEWKERCERDEQCSRAMKSFPSSPSCWGYEEGCGRNESQSGEPKCGLRRRKSHPISPQQQADSWWRYADWGYAEERRPKHVICEGGEGEGWSRVECSDHLRHCVATNIFFDFKSLNKEGSKRYREDVIRSGEVGGRCARVDGAALDREGTHQGYLQSWWHELHHFESREDFRVDDAHCDVIFGRPTIIIKLDAAVNMYHHFCDFVNLYVSQHINGSFDQDVDIVWWDTFSGGFVDPYFGDTWKAFSHRRPTELISLDGKRVCFRNALLPALARQRLGLFYNAPIVDGCAGSGLMRAFSQHIIHRLRIPQDGPVEGKVRVTLLSRSTQFRRIDNEKQLIRAMEMLPNVEVRRVDYNAKMPFLTQLASSHNSDVFIGMHGSGLTHMLFQPDWGAVFELYNCGDAGCYYDLARLRGVKYFTWSDESLVFASGDGRHPTSGDPHGKFTNYAFDETEFIRIVKQAVEYVRRHPQFVDAQRRLRRARIAKEQEKEEL